MPEAFYSPAIHIEVWEAMRSQEQPVTLGELALLLLNDKGMKRKEISAREYNLFKLRIKTSVQQSDRLEINTELRDKNLFNIITHVKY